MKVRAKKKLGQHFLRDENIARNIVDSLDNTLSHTILEIGPGTGILTQFLRANSSNCFHIEIDPESIEYLKENYSNIDKKLIEGDFLKVDLHSISEDSISIIGNFPYNISSQIFFKILDNVSLIPEVVCMIQYEVAQRISSSPNSKQYGILSVLLQAYYDIEFLFKVPPHVFIPPPKVDSGVIRLRRKPNYETLLTCNKKLFKSVIKTAFNQRRKMLSNSLKPILGKYSLNNGLENKRPEQLSVEDFVSLTNEIEKLIN